MIDPDKMIYDVPVFGVCGVSDTGKTALVCNVVKELTKKGFDIATIKHTEGEFSIDEEGKDTWRHMESGSDLVVFSSRIETDFIVKKVLDLDEIISVIGDMGDYDAVIIEGMKEANIPKIDLNDDKSGIEDRVKLVSERIEEEIELNEILEKLPKTDCKRCGYKSCEELAASVRDGRAALDSCEILGDNKDGVRLCVDGKEVPLGSFPSKLIGRTVKGMLSSLNGVDEDVEEIELKILEVER